MSLLKPCNACMARESGKLSTLFWAWNRADHTRVAYRQQLCVTCYAVNVLPLDPPEHVDSLMCPVCHTGSEAQLDPVYLTMYVPGQGRISWELATCGPCAVKVRIFAQVGSELLPDRSGESLGAAGGPQTDATMAAWDAIFRDRPVSGE